MSQLSGFSKFKYTLRRLLNLRRSGPGEGRAFYDRMYDTEAEYRRDFRDSIYLSVWSQVYRFLRQAPEARVLEVGCGAGQFADYLKFLGFENYFKGFDLSPQAVEMARRRVPFSFEAGNACDPAMYAGDYNTVITLEVLEHIPDDLAVLKNLRPGTFLIASLPDFEYESHYRWFTNPRQIEKRYYRHLDIRRIVKVDRWYVLFAVVAPINPTFFQRRFKTRGRLNTIFLWNRFCKPVIHGFGKPLIRAIFSR